MMIKNDNDYGDDVNNDNNNNNSPPPPISSRSNMKEVITQNIKYLDRSESLKQEQEAETVEPEASLDSCDHLSILAFFVIHT